MLTIQPTKNFYYYLKKSQLLLDFSKKVFSANTYTRTSSYYTAVLNQYLNYDLYINMFTNAIGLNAIQTNSTIQTDILGANSKGVIAKNGKPTYIFTEDKITIYVYKWKFNNLKTRCEIHFYNNKAFLVNYTYNMLTKADKIFITKTITQKYLDRNIDIKDCKITDDNNNVLFINDGMEFKVTYLSTKNSDWYDSMKNDINIKKEKRKAKSKLAEQRLYSKI